VCRRVMPDSQSCRMNLVTVLVLRDLSRRIEKIGLN
jgi:hypothetical protein